MALSIAEVRRNLPVGTIYRVTYLGPPILVYGNTGLVVMPTPDPVRRRVIKQNEKQMVSVYLEGEKKGQHVYLTWEGTTATREGHKTFLLEADEQFLKIEVV